MNKAQLEQRIARLESIHDHIEAEIEYVDTLLKSVGFPQGIASAKEVALELIQEAGQQEESYIKRKKEDVE